MTIPELVVSGRKLNLSVICDDCATKQEMKANADASANANAHSIIFCESYQFKLVIFHLNNDIL
jgi:hypothetical protein